MPAQALDARVRVAAVAVDLESESKKSQNWLDWGKNHRLMGKLEYW